MVQKNNTNIYTVPIYVLTNFHKNIQVQKYVLVILVEIVPVHIFLGSMIQKRLCTTPYIFSQRMCSICTNKYKRINFFDIEFGFYSTKYLVW